MTSSHNFLNYKFIIILITFFFGFRIKRDLVDPEKLQETLADASLHEACDLKRGMEMVVLLESQLKEMNPNLESISEYAFFLLTNILVLPFRMLPFLRLFCMVGIERKCPCTMNAWKSLILLLSNVMRLRSDMMN